MGGGVWGVCMFLVLRGRVLVSRVRVVNGMGGGGTIGLRRKGLRGCGRKGKSG